MEIIPTILKMAHHFGEYGHIFLPLYVSFFIFYMKKYLWGFWGFLIVNEFLNWILKRIFREKRPAHLLHNPDDYDYFGMPSGHSQHATFSLMFLCMLVEGGIAHIFLFFLCGIVMGQRYLTKKHSIPQIMVGGIVGLVFGYSAFLFTKKWIVNSDLGEELQNDKD